MPDASIIAARERQKLIDEARAEERRKVVEWLRETSTTSGYHYDVSGHALIWAANAIEGEQHHFLDHLERLSKNCDLKVQEKQG